MSFDPKEVIEKATGEAIDAFYASRPNLKRAIEAVPKLRDEQVESLRKTPAYQALLAGVTKAEQAADTFTAVQAIVAAVIPALLGRGA
ncbi:MAG TPA: hypothetical protein VMY35_07615 [Phycisphaerae bacterium]|nr:hypothetical protein [Phycisphaerae bacterium]